MPFSGGIFTLAEPAFQPNTTIASSAVNSDLSDIADGLTDCITKDGQSTPTAVIPLHADGFNYSVDPDTGMHRTAANTQAIKAGGTDIVTIDTTGETVTGDLVVSGTITGGGFNTAAIVGEIRAYALTTAPSGWALCYGQALTAVSPLRTALIAASNPYGVSGADPLVPDLRGRAPFGKDNMGGSTAGRITNAGSGIVGTTLGETGGAQNITIAQSNLPNVNLSSAGLSSSVQIFASGQSFVLNPGSQFALQDLSTTGGGGTVNRTYAPTISGTIPLGGSGNVVTSISPTIIVNYIIFVGA